MTGKELETRIQILSKPSIHNAERAIKQLLRDFAEAITPERLEPKPEDYDGFGDYSHVIRMQQATIDTIQQNTNKLLGEK